MNRVGIVSGRAYRLPQPNIDTDVIIAASRLKTISRTGLGVFAFEKLRTDPNNAFDDTSMRAAPILIAGANFGCGSSREHAVWAMADMGIQVVIASGFGDIFATNAVKNGFLTVRLTEPQVRSLLDLPLTSEITVDLPAQRVTSDAGDTFAFDIDAFQKNCLVNGLDHIGISLQLTDDIDVFEMRRLAETPWLADTTRC